VHFQVHLRTLTPFTQTVLQTTTGFRTTTAPRGPAQAARTTPSAQTTALAVRDSIVMVAEKASRAAPASSNERMLFSSNGCCCRQCSADETYFFCASASTFLQAGVSLSLSLARQAMIRPPPGTVTLAEFFVVAHAGVALGGGQFLCQSAGGKQQGNRSDGDA
jgi:hypothetical protein